MIRILQTLDALLRRANRGETDAGLKPMRLFHWSNSYLALLFVAAAVAPLLFSDAYSRDTTPEIPCPGERGYAGP